jgi:hypothetical protein
LQYRHGDPAQAERLARFVAAHPRADEAANAHLLLAMLAQRAQRPAAAEAELREALRLRPDHAPALAMLTRILVRQGRRAEAEGAIAAAAPAAREAPEVRQALAEPAPAAP